MIPGDLLSAFPHRQFHTLPGLLDSWAALPNSYPNALRVMQGGSLYHFYDGLWYDPAERRTHDLPCERRTRYRLSQPDTVTEKEIDISRTFFELSRKRFEPTNYETDYSHTYRPLICLLRGTHSTSLLCGPDWQSRYSSNNTL